MLQIGSLDEGKSDWMSETQLIIPMVDNEEIHTKEIDVLPKGSIALNSLEGTDQSLLTNAAGHTFVIGLERNLFENYNSKSDLLLMQNSDLKLLSTVQDSKVTYGLSTVDQPKSDIVWGNAAYEKPLSKDILSVIQESSKHWNELGKSGELSLEDIQDNKLNSDFLIESDLVRQPKKSGDQQYILGYYPIVEACDAVLVAASLTSAQQKGIDTLRSQKAIVIDNDVIFNAKNLNQLLINDNVQDTQTIKWIKSQENSVSDVLPDKLNNDIQVSLLKISNTQKKSIILEPENIDKLNESVIPVIDNANGHYGETKSDEKIMHRELQKSLAKDEECDAIENINDILLEQSLPLKKKAKMKKSPIGENIIQGIDNLKSNHKTEFHLFENRDGTYEINPTLLNSNTAMICRGSNSISNEPRSNYAKRKAESTTYNFKKKKKRADDEQKIAKKFVGSRKGSVTEPITELSNGSRQGDQQFKTISNVLEQLKSEKLINEAVFKVLLTGLQEMDVDILKEMYSKRDSGSSEYSSHLKAFALMLHFKQPSAFNRLRDIFENGWPPLAVIKEWKRQLNSQRKPRIKF